MSTIALENLTKSFGDTPVFTDVSLTIEDHEFVVFVGPSGCGKSTLLRLVAGLEPATAGRVLIDGRDVTGLRPHDRGLSMVFQSYALYPHMSVRENIAFALHRERLTSAQRDERVAQAASALQLEPYLERKPRALSGGQRQRVAIGRAIVRQPRAFLFDEPLSNLDAALRAETRLEIATLHKRLQATTLYVTHDQVEAMTLADRIVVMNAGEVMQVGTPRELYTSPANVFVAQFIGSPKMNLVECKTDGAVLVLPGGARLALPVPLPRPAARLGVRPEDLRLTEPGEGQLPATVEVVEYLGNDAFVFLDAGPAGRIAVRTPGTTRPADGAPARIAIDPSDCHFFDQEGHAIRTRC